MTEDAVRESVRSGMREYIETLQDRITSRIEEIDGKATFRRDVWEREGGGGGRTSILEEGAVFERAAVSISDVHGTLSEAFAQKMGGDGTNFSARGLSLIFHPWNPMVPTVHANIRYIEIGTKAWFGGGTDLTPYYLRDEDARHFHSTLKKVCDRYDTERYETLKKTCDNYFYLKNRHECRGVGGIFFDHLAGDLETDFDFVRDCGDAIMEAYGPIAERRKSESYTDEQRRWQEIRRGRYVEFNLLYDKGTIFGFQTDGRTESILVSMPPRARWVYAHEPTSGTPEAELLDVLRNPREWA